MEQLDDVCHMKYRFGPFSESVSFGARKVHGLRLEQHRLRNRCESTRWYSWAKRLKWKLGLVYLDIVLILMQDRSTVCMKHTICLEINLDTPNGTRS